MREQYQGHANYPTWAICLWVANDEGLYRDAIEYVSAWDVESETGFGGVQDADGLLGEQYLIHLDELLGDGTDTYVAGPLSDIAQWAWQQIDATEVGQFLRELVSQ